MIKLIKTDDGSCSLSNTKLNESYHSINGALAESELVYIKNGLNFLLERKTNINIFEAGFGTGLNCFLTYINGNGADINYYTVEKYPVSAGMVDSLNYSNLLDLKRGIVQRVHSDSTCVLLNKKFRLYKYIVDLIDFNHKEYYDLVYFDAFSPKTQPELWTFDILKQIGENMNYGGVFVTYSTAGKLKRSLRKLGFEVELLPGPKGKRHVLRAIKKGSVARPL